MPQTSSALPVPSGLSGLDSLPLTPVNAALLERAASWSLGAPTWRARKLVEAREILALSQIAPRFRVEYLDLTGALRAKVQLRVPVPCLPDKDGKLTLAPQAALGITWPQEVLVERLPGSAFVQVLSPQGVVWHPNCGFGPVQALCLGIDLPAGVRVRELVLMSYCALSLQAVQLDVLDPAGVLNPAAALYFQQQGPQLVPLSRVPFLGTDDLRDPRRAGGAG